TVAVSWIRPRPLAVLKTEPGVQCWQYETWLRQTRVGPGGPMAPEKMLARNSSGAGSRQTAPAWAGDPDRGKRRHCGTTSPGGTPKRPATRPGMGTHPCTQV